MQGKTPGSVQGKTSGARVPVSRFLKFPIVMNFSARESGRKKPPARAPGWVGPGGHVRGAGGQPPGPSGPSGPAAGGFLQGPAGPGALWRAAGGPTNTEARAVVGVDVAGGPGQGKGRAAGVALGSGVASERRI